MPHTCCAPRCFNKSDEGYALMRFPKEEQHQKMWSDAIFGKNASKRSLENLRLCEVHFDQSDLLVVGRRKEIKKGAIPARFCQCSSVDFCNKSQTSKRKKKGTHVRNVKTKLDSENSNQQYIEHSYSFISSILTENRVPLKQISPNIVEHSYNNQILKQKHIYNKYSDLQINTCKQVSNLSTACGIYDENCTKIVTRFSKKQMCDIKHETNCPFTVSPVQIYEIKKTIEIESSKANCLHDINMNIMESLTEKIDQSKSQKKSVTDENEIQGKYKENNKHEQKEGKQSNYWMQDFRKICKENFNLKEQIKILNNCLQKTQIYFANDQLRVLGTGTSRGMKWSEDTILKGLSLRFTCGTRGYNYVRQIMAPLPSVRTLQRSIEHIKFNPGLLDSVFLRLQEMIHNMNENDRNFVLIFDEMSIEQRIDLDPSTGAYIGYVSLPGVPKQLASKALVFLLAGIRKRYKQVVAYHFTTGKAYHEAIVEVIMKILERCEQIGFTVLALVCDMGNRGLLARLGFSHKKNFMIYSRTHPFNANRLLYAMPDFIHVFKSLKEMFMKNKIIFLPDDVVYNEKLESNIINFEYIEWLEDRQLNMDLKGPRTDYMEICPPMKLAEI